VGEALGPDRTILRRRLRSELRRAREAANLTPREVAAAMDWSQSKLIRIESGAVGISTNDLRALLTHYNIDSIRIGILVDIARAAREPTQWSIYRNVASAEYITFLGYESSASTIRNFEPLFIPDLLQTEEYARTVISVVEARNSCKIDSLVDLCVQRQELIVRDNGPRIQAIMDEAVIRRVVGGQNVMRQQLQYLQTLAEHPRVTIRIVSFTRGVYPCQWVSYVLLGFRDPNDGDLLYVKNLCGEYVVREDLLNEKRAESAASYLAIFKMVERIASQENTLKLLKDAIDGLIPRVGNR
jgi:transcriptional regulator with XRE-family HTH domain